jgi:hypothetical protein
VVGPLPACVDIQDEMLIIPDNLENKHFKAIFSQDYHIDAYLDNTFHIEAHPSPNTAFHF